MWWALGAILGVQLWTLSQVLRLTRASARQKGWLTMTLDDLVNRVTGLTDVDQGLSEAIDTLIAQDADLAQRLKDAIASSDPVKLQAVADALDQNIAALTAKKQAVIDAVTANT